MKDNVSIRAATRNDIQAIMEIEQQPGYAERVGSYDEETHAHKMGLPDHRYIVAQIDGTICGFAVLRQPDDGKGIANLNRIAVRSASQGVGTPFIVQLINLIFSDQDVERLWLDVLPSNDIARHVYTKIGFVEEGLMRSALRYPDGRRTDLVLMSLLRNEWVDAPKRLI